MKSEVERLAEENTALRARVAQLESREGKLIDILGRSRSCHPFTSSCPVAKLYGLVRWEDVEVEIEIDTDGDE